MQSHIGVGIGKYIEKEFLNSKTSIMISSPVITTKIANMLMELALKGIHIKIVTSPRDNEESEKANIMLSTFLNQKNSICQAKISGMIFRTKSRTGLCLTYLDLLIHIGLLKHLFLLFFMSKSGIIGQSSLFFDRKLAWLDKLSNHKWKLDKLR